MRKIFQNIGIYKQNYWLVTILAGGLCFASQAQTPSFSKDGLPPLPPPPLAATPSIPLTPDPVKPVSAAEPLSKALPYPEFAALPPIPEPTAPGTGTPFNKPVPPAIATGGGPSDAPPAIVSPPLAELPPPLPESSAPPPVGTNLPAAETALANPLPLPPPLGLEPPSLDRASPIISASPTSVSTLPEVTVATKKPSIKSWKTVLAPTVIPTQTNFNYRRVILPGTIYRSAYDADNRHLPTAVTREQYVALLFQRVAANDVEATRTLLNTGLSPDEPGASGETPLSVARRAGAADTAALLVARGARGYNISELN